MQKRTSKSPVSSNRPARAFARSGGRAIRSGKYVVVPTAEYERLVVRQAAQHAANILDNATDADWVDADKALAAMAKSRIAQARTKRGWTQRELGRRLGMPQSQVSRLEKNPDSSTLRQIKRVAEVLGVDAADLL